MMFFDMTSAPRDGKALILAVKDCEGDLYVCTGRWVQDFGRSCWQAYIGTKEEWEPNLHNIGDAVVGWRPMGCIKVENSDDGNPLRKL